MPFKPGYPNLYDFDVYPKVVRAGKEVTITVKPTGRLNVFKAGETYHVSVKGINGGKPEYFPLLSEFEHKDVVCSADGCIRLTHTFRSEQEYFIDIPYINHRGKEAQERFCIYCVDGDLTGVYPFIGDLHTHTTMSDGSQDPEIVCANYRSHGYDFIAITDHRRYYPSLRAIRYYSKLPTDLTVLPGEEVHLPMAKGQYIDPHIISIGAEYSVNALIERTDADNVPIDKPNRSLYGECPEIMNQEQYEAVLEAKSAEIDIPEGIDRIPALGVKWAYDEIRKAKGLAIFPHPTWIHDVFHVPEAFQDYIVNNRMFDAFEVLGGENYYEQNGFQTIRYYEDKAKGIRYPVVGSTDSHNSNETNRNALICSTIVFAGSNELQSLMNAIREFRSVAVDTISAEPRFIGESRYVRYACFLTKNYFPIHDEMCYEEGRALKQYITGDEAEKASALNVLKATKGRVPGLLNKYFAF